MPAMWWLVGAVAVIVLVATYLTWIAARVDRLHHRAAAAYSALDAQLVRRAAATMTLADADPSLGERAGPLRSAAQAAQRASADSREIAENRLTKLLREFSPHPNGAGPAPEHDAAAVAIAEVFTASRRVALARQVHTDLVRDTLAARRRPVARMLGLDRRHPKPRYFDIEDPVLDS